MPTYIKTVSFYNRAALVGQFDFRSDDELLNRELDAIGRQGAEIVNISTTSSGVFSSTFSLT